MYLKCINIKIDIKYRVVFQKNIFLNKMFYICTGLNKKYVIESRKRWVIAFIITAIVVMVESLFLPTKLPDAGSGVF